MKMITPYVANENQNLKVKGMNVETPAPRRETLDWIRQFARVYTYDPRLGTDKLGSFIVN